MTNFKIPTKRQHLLMTILTFWHTILTFNDPDEEALQNIVGKVENADKQHFPFPAMFSTLSEQ